MRTALLACLAPFAAALPAAAEPAAELPLERGFYVRTDETCGGATPAGVHLVARDGIRWVTSFCVFEAIERSGPDAFAVTQRCGDAAHSETRQADWRIESPRAFSFVDADGWAHEARFCPQDELPEPWRDADVADLIR